MAFLSDGVGGALCSPPQWAVLNEQPQRLPRAPSTPDGLPFGVALMPVTTPECARALLGPRDPDERRRRSTVFFQPKTYRARARLPLGIHDRIEEYFLADGELCTADQAGHARGTPIYLKSIRLRALSLGPDEVIDLSAVAQRDWPGLHPNQELYLRVQIDELRVAPGSGLSWSGQVACVQIGSLIGTQALTGDRPFTLRIRGTARPAYSAHRARVPTAGQAGAPGAPGLDSRPAIVACTPFGPHKVEAPPLPATPGAPGESGTAGQQGRSGGLLMVAGIEVMALHNFGPRSLYLDVQAGDGEAGTCGGEGGAGGHGGDGAAGRQLAGGDDLLNTDGASGSDGRGGDGAAGGRGGDGAAGGRGGPGGLASHVFLTLPPNGLCAAAIAARPAAGGAGGEGGKGGAGGRGGRGGSGTSRPFQASAPDGASGLDGEPGKPGPSGAPGKVGPVPPVWLHVGAIPANVAVLCG